MVQEKNLDPATFPAYERNLPHQYPAGFAVFFTWNLQGAIPTAVLQEKEAERLRLANEPLRADESPRDRQLRHDKLLFAMQDQAIGRNPEGPHHLKVSRAAQFVVESILFGVPERYNLYAFVVMSNHVHVLIAPRLQPEKIMQGIKGFTSRQINLLQNATGRKLWQHESYDHCARDAAELLRIIEYIENNPVKASLCVRPEDWRWSSAGMRVDWPKVQPWKKPDL